MAAVSSAGAEGEVMAEKIPGPVERYPLDVDYEGHRYSGSYGVQYGLIYAYYGDEWKSYRRGQTDGRGNLRACETSPAGSGESGP